jgi:anti-sigma regulatory factor (Ser/Thr protein kinase)
MINTDVIIEIVNSQGRVTTRELSDRFGVSRQYLNQLISKLVAEGILIKIGGTRTAFYVSAGYLKDHPQFIKDAFVKKYKNVALEEYRVLMEIEQKLPLIAGLPENIRSIFAFAFSEMLNNAIEHSNSKRIDIGVIVRNGKLTFTIDDSGIGVFRSIIKKKKLHSETEAIQDLLKGKTTTMPKSHSGEGIFFTSKSGDRFTLDSFGYQLIITADPKDVKINNVASHKRGTRVIFEIATDSQRYLAEVFNKYANVTDDSDYGFDKTEIRVKLYETSGINISRSQARRILSGLEKFKIIILDFENVPIVGQSFADEIYRVFQKSHPDIVLQEENMSEGVRFMISRAKNEAKIER